MSYTSKHKALALRIKEAGIVYFTAKEVLTLGGNHYASRSSGYGKNKLPPNELLQNIIPALKALDTARWRLGRPVGINSTYRSAGYNKAIGGAKKSKHLSFQAIDCHPYDKENIDQLYRLLADARERGEWTGGLGGYRTFIHVDCGSPYNRTWGIEY